MNDDLLKEAMGASEKGFNESSIPRQIQLESSFDQPGFFGRLFGKKNNLAKSLTDQPLSESEVESLFASRQAEDQQTQPSPAEHQPLKEEPAEDERFDEHSLDVDETPEDEESLHEELETKEQDNDDIEDIEIDDDALSEIDDIDDIDLESLEEQADVDVDEDIELGEDADLEDMEGLEDIGDLDDLDIDDLDADEDDQEEMDLEGDELDMEEEDLELETGDLDEIGEEALGEDDDSKEPDFLERLFSKIQLSQAEMWTVMIGSVVTMLSVLGIIVYWWLTMSPQAQNSLWDDAVEHYGTAIEYQKFPDEHGWNEIRTEYREAADLFEEFIQKFPNHEKTAQGFENLCECYYRIANGWENEGKPKEAEEPYRVMIQLYNNYLNYLNDQAMKMSQVQDQDLRYKAYPDPEARRQALLRIAEGHRKLQNFEQAIASLTEFVNNYRQSPEAVTAQIQKAKAYENMAEVNKENENDLLAKSVSTYKKTLQDFVPADQHKRRMNLYTGMGDVHFRQYNNANNETNPDQARTALEEATASYEKALEEFRDAEGVSFDEKVDLFTKLADLYLIRGRKAGTEWQNYSETGSLFAEGMQYREELLDAAQRSREAASQYLGKARNLYDELLKNRDQLSPEDLYEILYNIAQSNFILQNYPEAIASGERLLDMADSIDDETKLAKVHYLMGHISWEQARESKDYSKVKEHYREALRLDSFYPKEENGETSHLAEIRLTNAYFMLDYHYEDAIARFEQAKQNYPDTGYTFLTLNWYGKALEEYGDTLAAEAESKINQADEMNLPSLKQEAVSLNRRARELYEHAVLEYTNAIESRDDSTYVDHKNQRFLIDIVFSRAHSAYKARNYTKAKDLYKQALENYRTKEAAQVHIPHAMERLGDINAKLLKYGEAIDYYKQYLEQAYEDQDARVSLKLADAYLSQFSYDNARQQYNKIIGYYPPPSERELLQKQRLGESLEKDPGSAAMKKIAESYYQQAGLLSGEARTNTLQKALDAYQDLAASYPKNPEAEAANRIPFDTQSQLMIGNLHYELENYASAARNYESFLTEWPNYSRKGMIYYRIGQCYTQLEQWDNAIESLTNITPNMMDNDIQHADAMILLGQAYENKANQMLQEGDEALYEVNLERASEAYGQVNTSNTEKRLQANLKRENIDTRLNGMRNVDQPSANAQSFAGQ